jgi:hypothetical protein
MYRHLFTKSEIDGFNLLEVSMSWEFGAAVAPQMTERHAERVDTC